MDDTEARRRELLPTMPDELLARVAAGESVWTTEEMRRDFTVLGFAAPLVVVTRKSDGVKGSLYFTHNPRFYFGWSEDS